MTPRPHSGRLAALAATLCVLSSQPAQAADLFGASLSVSQLRYRLIDLDPNDGIAPKLTIKGDDTWRALSQVSSPPEINEYYPEIYTPSLMETSYDLSSARPFIGGSAGGGDRNLSIASSGTGVSLDTVVREEDLPMIERTYDLYSPQSLVTTNSVTGDEGTLSYTSQERLSGSVAQRRLQFSTGPADADPFTPFPPMGMILSPRTLLLIEGTATMSLSADRTSLAGPTDTTPSFDYATPGHFETTYQNDSGSVSSELALTLTDNPDEYFPFNQNDGGTLSNLTLRQDLYYYGGQDFSYYGPGKNPLTEEPTQPGDTFSATYSKDWALQLANLDGEDKDLYFRLFGATDVNLRIQRTTTITDATFTPGEIPDPVGSIPEPGTYALMGLGLAGIGLARRRTRR